jgi:hypothetical protein
MILIFLLADNPQNYYADLSIFIFVLGLGFFEVFLEEVESIVCDISTQLQLGCDL